MFYQIQNHITPVDPAQIRPDVLSVGYVTADRLREMQAKFSFADATVDACSHADPQFRSGVEVYEEYTFTQLRIASLEGEDDCVALYIGHNLLLVVDVEDHDGSTKNTFLSAVQRCVPAKATTEKLLCAFLDALLTGDVQRLEAMRSAVSQMEETVLRGKPDPGITLEVLDLKKRILKLHNYYDQLLDIAETAAENDNDVLDGEELIHVSNLTKKVQRLREDVDGLGSALEHLQDAYSSALDLQLNHTMKILTVITTIFFPLTIIVGWYGMNFQSMPEFGWRFGYAYVIALSVLVIAVPLVLGRRKKWF